MTVVSIRRATPADVDFVVGLVAHEEVAPFLASVRARDRDAVLAEIERSGAEPEHYGVFVIEADGERAGTMSFEVSRSTGSTSGRSRTPSAPASSARAFAARRTGATASGWTGFCSACWRTN